MKRAMALGMAFGLLGLVVPAMAAPKDEANKKALQELSDFVGGWKGAGGTMCDWNGQPLHAGSDGHVLALGDPARLEDAVEALACGH